MISRVNNHQSCIACGRRADGLAVGKPGKLGWYCLECGSDLAKEALAMNSREFDIVERRAATAIAQSMGPDPVILQPEEMAAFIQWAVKEFAINMRKQIEEGAPPF